MTTVELVVRYETHYICDTRNTLGKNILTL